MEPCCQTPQPTPCANSRSMLTGPLEFHRNSLQHLSEAMRRTRRLCSTVIDTMGRELMVRGQWQVDNQVKLISGVESPRAYGKVMVCARQGRQWQVDN
eukprot:scaffold153262_cov18-Tisochrysis_lutea.AAC.2